MNRIVNIYNFIRAVEPRREEITPEVLYETTASQVCLLKDRGLPATFALQYDALLDERYQRLLQDELPAHSEVGAWWEIVQPHAERAGIAWRGRYPWDWHAHVGFSPGYAPAEREKLVDVYMEDFRAIFGHYPLSVGSWFIDAHTLGYMADRYGVIASCNCKDQVGTDGYTLWGGYWNQAYYPSRRNAYLPAQHEAAQIPVPVFRMLGSDPVYQYDDGLGTDRQKVLSLEPVYGNSGADPDWVRWFFGFTTSEPCLAFAYTQAGQENSFTWEKMRRGYEYQMEYIARLVDEGRIAAMTLADCGRWFRSSFPITPATAVTVTSDWQNRDSRTVWYNSRFYRANFLWQDGEFRVRDIHLFDEAYASVYLDEPLTVSTCRYDALPVVDGFHWSRAEELAGLRFVECTSEGERLLPVGDPAVSEDGDSVLRLTCAVEDLGQLEITCRENRLEFRLAEPARSVDWALSLHCAREAGLPLESIADTCVTFAHRGHTYQVACSWGQFAPPEAADQSRLVVLPRDQQIILALENKG